MTTAFLDALRDRVTSVCAGDPFRFVPTDSPFSFDLQPTGAIDAAFRVTAEMGAVTGGFNFSEIRTDPVVIWLARKRTAEPQVMYRQFLTDVSSLRAAVIRDGLTGGGDYDVPDAGASAVIRDDPGKEYAVLRFTVPINYETTV